jgi:hypothetical protein
MRARSRTRSLRSWTDSRRRRRPSLLERSRFGRGAHVNRDLIRFRRNRELLAREVTVLILWIAVAVMLLNLAQTMRVFSANQLGERSAILRYLLPSIPVLATVFCAWRARLNFREIREIRAEQTEVKARLAALEDEDDPSRS